MIVNHQHGECKVHHTDVTSYSSCLPHRVQPCSLISSHS